LPASSVPAGLTTTTSSASTSSSSPMHKSHSVYHFLPQHSGVKSARYRPPGFARNSNVVSGAIGSGPKRAVSAPGLQVSGSQSAAGKRDNSRSRRQQAMSLTSGKSFPRILAPQLSAYLDSLHFLRNSRSGLLIDMARYNVYM
jgi:hypothetical protein